MITKSLMMFLVMLAVVPSYAADISLGPLCVTGVQERADPTDLSFSNGHQWMRVVHTYKAPKSGSKASLVLFSKPVPQDPDSPPDCTKLRETAKANDIGVTLEGLIESLDMRSRVGSGVLGNRLWIDPDGSFTLTMKKVNSGLQPVGGGALQLQGSYLWIRRVGAILSTPDSISGTIEVEAYNRSIDGAKLSLPGGGSALATLKLRNPDRENLFLRLNLSNGEAQIWRADMVASNVRVAGPSMTISALQLGQFTATASTMRIKASNGVLTGTMEEVEGEADRLVATKEHVTFEADDVSFFNTNISGEIKQELSNFSWKALSASGFNAESSETMMAVKQNVLVEGAAIAKFSKISSSEIDGSVEWIRPKIANVPLSIPEGQGKRFRILLSGRSGGTEVAGFLSAEAFRISGIEVNRDVALSFVSGPSSAVVDIPIDINAPGLAGEIKLHDLDQSIFLKAALAGFHLKANLFLDLDDPVEGSRLEILPGGLSAGLSNTVSLEPWLAGTKPGFGRFGVTISNSEQIVIRKTNPTGTLEFNAGVIALAEPILRIGEGAEKRRSSITLNSIGNALFSYGVNDRKMVMQKVRFEVRDLFFHMLDSGGTIDLGGTSITEPKVSMKNLSIDINRKSDFQVMRAEEIRVEGENFTRNRTVKTETAFSGEQSSPFAIGRLTGVPEFNDTSITVREIVVDNLSFALKNASLTLGESLSLRNSVISLSANRIQSIDEIQKNTDGSDLLDDKGNVIRKRREYFTNVKINASGTLRESEFSDSMQLDVPPDVIDLHLEASGRSDLLNGSGGVRISPFSGRYKGNVEFEFACKGGGHPIAPTETRFTTGGTPFEPLGVEVKDGKFGIEGTLVGLNISYKGDTQVECDSESEKYVISPKQEWWTWGICPTWSEPFRKCKWSTVVPEVSVGYHLRFGYYGLAGQATIGAPVMSIKNGETKFCFAPPVVLNPLVIAMGISPQVEFSGANPGDVEKVLNGIIHTALVPVESAFLTSVGNTAALAVGSTLTTPAGALLSCALLRKDI